VLEGKDSGKETKKALKVPNSSQRHTQPNLPVRIYPLVLGTFSASNTSPCLFEAGAWNVVFAGSKKRLYFLFV